MVSDGQLHVIERRCAELTNEHQRNLMHISMEFQEMLVPSSRPRLPHGMDKLFSSRIVSCISEFNDEISREIPALVQKMQIDFNEEGVSDVMSVCESMFSEERYDNRLKAYESMISTWFSRFNMTSPRRKNEKAMLSATYSCWVKNTLREKRLALKNRLDTIAYTNPSRLSAKEAELDKGIGETINDFVNIKPNLFGIGLDFNSLIKRFRNLSK